MNKQELKSLLENIYTALKEDEGDFVGPPDPTYPDFSREDLERLTRELFPNGNPIRPLTPEELDPFHPPLWWTLGDKLWRWWHSFSQRPIDPMEVGYERVPQFWYYDAQGNPQQQPWSFPRDDPRYREVHEHDWGPPSLRPAAVQEALENIYSTLAEQNPPPLPPRLHYPDGPPTGPPPTPPDVYRNDPARDPNWTPPDLGGGWYWRYRGTPPTGHWIPYPPDATPVPPKPKPTPTPNPELSSPRPPRPGFNPENPFDPRNPFRLPNPPKPPPLSPGQQQIRDALRELGFPESEIEQIIN